MSPIMVDSYSNITNSYGKIYMATIMGLSMVLLEIGMHDHTYHIFSSNYYLLFGGLLALFIYLYRQQVGIYDKQYLEGMIEHHSMAILTSKKILEKTDSYRVAKIAKDILQTQQDEITKMKHLIKNI